MTELIKKDDFIEIEYNARLKSSNKMFDTTSPEIAKKNGLLNQGIGDGPRIICVGREQLLKGLDESFIDKTFSENYTLELNSNQAFGKKDPKLVKLIPESKFKKSGVRPLAGFQFKIDGKIGQIISVNGGRVVIDFNDPLAGKDIIYEVKINRLVTDFEEKIKGFLNLALNVTKTAITIKDKEIKVDINYPNDFVEHVKNKLNQVIPETKDYSFIVKKQ